MHLVDPLPYAVGKYRSRQFAQKLNALLAETPYDLIVCDFLFPSVNLPRQLPCPAVIFTHNVEAEIWRRHAETRHGLARLLYRAQYTRMLRYEESVLRRFDGVLVVSDADRQTFARLYPGRHSAGRSRRLDRRRHRVLLAGAECRGRTRPRLHRLDGLAAERGRDDVFLP